MPGLNMMLESTKTFEEMFKWILDQAQTGLIILEPKPDLRTAYIVSPSQHFQFNLMSEKEYNRMASEQRYAAMQQGRMQ